MHKNKSFFCSLFLTGFLLILSLPLQAWDCCEPFGITAEARVAYYRPSSNRVRRIYGDGDGWADYQFELSKAFRGFGIFGLGGEGSNNGGFGGGGFGSCDDCGCGGLNDLEWRVWVGVNGFSRKGESIGFDDRTRLQLIPINFGLKIFYPIFCNTKVFIGGAACYSFLRIRDHSEYVRKHTRKEDWGGLIQSGITYNFCDWGVVSAFADYYFQRFDFHSTDYSSFYGSGYSYNDHRYIERHSLDMSGYKVGVGLGVTF
jgi:outer membrane protein